MGDVHVPLPRLPQDGGGMGRRIRPQQAAVRRENPLPQRLQRLLQPVVSDYGNRGRVYLTGGQKTPCGGPGKIKRPRSKVSAAKGTAPCRKECSGRLGELAATRPPAPLPRARGRRLPDLFPPAPHLPQVRDSPLQPEEAGPALRVRTELQAG